MSLLANYIDDLYPTVFLVMVSNVNSINSHYLFLPLQW